MMRVSNIYGEVSKHEVWECVCKEGKFYVDAIQDYKVVHWNYPEITPNQEQIEKAKLMIEQKKYGRNKNERIYRKADW